MVHFNNEWDTILAPEFNKQYYLELKEFLKFEYKNYNIFPPMNDIFNALKYTSFNDVKVVILGQDPYINKGEAHGFSFSVNKGIKIPPSLKNIYKEIADDIGCEIPNHGNLLKWSEQGVLLLNTVLTVREKLSNSHKNKGWEKFTDAVISKINNREKPVVFLLWGNNAIAKQNLITNPNHLILTAKHPSPLAQGAFFGCKHFSKTNKFLLDNKIVPIEWQIE